MATKHKEESYPPHRAARQGGKAQRKKRSTGKVALGRTVKAARPAKVTKPAKSRRPKPVVPSSRQAEPIPDEAAIQELLASLGPAERNAVKSILQGLEEHFGTPEAARVWLATESPEFGITPLEAIRRGKARLVQAVLEAQWGPNPAYA